MSKNGSGKSLFTFFLGLAVGGAVGLLLAPNNGKTTRSKLSFLIEKYTMNLKGLIEELKQSEKKFEDKAKIDGENIISKTKEKAEKLLDDVNNVMAKIKK